MSASLTLGDAGVMEEAHYQMNVAQLQRVMPKLDRDAQQQCLGECLLKLCMSGVGTDV